MSSVDLRFVPGRSLPQVDPPRSPRETLPTMYDLPSEFPEEPGLPDEFHDLQPQLLSRTLSLVDYKRQNYFTASDLNIYYDVNHQIWHKRPDWFLAVGVDRLYEGEALRNSYVVWQEGIAPHVIVEFLSLGTSREDLGRFADAKSAVKESLTESADHSNQPNKSATKETPPDKFTVYEKYLRVPHYITYDRRNQSLRYFRWSGGQYAEQTLRDGICRIWLDDLKIGLGLWEGEFDEATSKWLRWCDEEGNWLLTDTEQARQAEGQARQAEGAAESRLMQAARNLIATGMLLEEVANLLELSAEQLQLLQDEL